MTEVVSRNKVEYHRYKMMNERPRGENKEERRKKKERRKRNEDIYLDDLISYYTPKQEEAEEQARRGQQIASHYCRSIEVTTFD